MKKIILIFSLLITCLVSWAQEESNVSIIYNPTDTLYRFVEVTTYDDGESVDTTLVRYFPNNWLNVQQFQNYLFQITDQTKERFNELHRLRREVLEEQNFYIATIDTIYGAGTYQAIINQRTLQQAQGSWRLRYDNTNTEEREIWRVSIVNNTVAEDNGSDPMAGTFNVVDETNATLVWNGDMVQLTLLSNGVWRWRQGARMYRLVR